MFRVTHHATLPGYHEETIMNEKPVRVFLVDDDEDDYVLTRDMLA